MASDGAAAFKVRSKLGAKLPTQPVAAAPRERQSATARASERERARAEKSVRALFMTLLQRERLVYKELKLFFLLLLLLRQLYGLIN